MAEPSVKPPIPSPWTEPVEPAPRRAITKRVEWDEEQQCFVLAYGGGLWSGIRGGWKLGFYDSIAFLTMTVGLPMFLLGSTVIGLIQKGLQLDNCFFISAAGVRDLMLFPTFIPWNEVRGIINHRGDLLILCRPFYKAACYIPRENFVDMAECQKVEAILHDCWQGEDWESVKSRFRS